MVIIDNTTIIDSPAECPDELSLCDEEIRKVFEGKGNYFIGTAIMAQLAKNIKELNETIKAANL